MKLGQIFFYLIFIWISQESDYIFNSIIFVLMLSMLILRKGDSEFQDKSCLKYISFLFLFSNRAQEHLFWSLSNLYRELIKNVSFYFVYNSGCKKKLSFIVSYYLT